MGGATTKPTNQTAMTIMTDENSLETQPEEDRYSFDDDQVTNNNENDDAIVNDSEYNKKLR